MMTEVVVGVMPLKVKECQELTAGGGAEGFLLCYEEIVMPAF